MDRCTLCSFPLLRFQGIVDKHYSIQFSNLGLGCICVPDIKMLAQSITQVTMSHAHLDTVGSSYCKRVFEKYSTYCTILKNAVDDHDPHKFKHEQV